MKLSSLLLGVSLATNLALTGVLLFKPSQRPPADAASAVDGAARPSAASPGGATAGAQASSRDAGAAAPAGQSWARLRTDDLAALVPRLQAAGFPPLMVRRIVATLVTEQFDRRRLELEKENLAAPIWANTQNPYMDPKIGSEYRKLQREQTELMGRLFGGSLHEVLADTEENKALLRHQIGDIAGEKIDRLYAAAMDHSERISQIYAAANSGRTMLNADREKLAELERKFRAEIDTFLTPTEAAEFMMRGSMTGSQLRSTLAPFQPSEQEYRALFPIYQAFQEQFPGQAAGLSPEQTIARRAAEDLMQEQLKGLLGADRAADFKQAIDPAFAQLNRLVGRLEMPISAARQVAAVQRDMQTRAGALHADRTLATADRNTQLAALAGEASTKIGAALGGARGLEAYKQYGGQWLDSLVPRPPAPPPKN